MGGCGLGAAGGQRATVGCEQGGGESSGFTCGFLQRSPFWYCFLWCLSWPKIPVSDVCREPSPERLYRAEPKAPLGAFLFSLQAGARVCGSEQHVSNQTRDPDPVAGVRALPAPPQPERGTHWPGRLLHRPGQGRCGWVFLACAGCGGRTAAPPGSA